MNRRGSAITGSRAATTGSRRSGYETEISIVDIDFEPTSPQTDTLSLDLTCTNRDLPAMLAFAEGGDLFQEGGAQTSGISLLRRPTQSVRFERGRARTGGSCRISRSITCRW